MPFALLLWEFKRGNKWDCDPKGTGQECHIDKFCPLKWGTPIMRMHEGSTLFIMVN